MSTTAISSLFLKDILDVCGMKPWWEQVRAFLFLLSMAVELFLVYDIEQPYEVVCFPKNTSIRIETWDTKIANAICASEVPKWILPFRFFNVLLLGVLTFGIYASWLMIPRVRHTFETLRKCDDIVKDLNLTPQDLRNVVLHLCKDCIANQSDVKTDIDNTKSNVSGACCDIWSGPPSKKEFPIPVEDLRFPGDRKSNDNIQVSVSDEFKRKVSSVCCDLWSNSVAQFPISVEMSYKLRNRIACFPILLSILSLYKAHESLGKKFFPCQARGVDQTCLQRHFIQKGPIMLLVVLQMLLIFWNLTQLRQRYVNHLFIKCLLRSHGFQTQSIAQLFSYGTIYYVLRCVAYIPNIGTMILVVLGVIIAKTPNFFVQDALMKMFQFEQPNKDRYRDPSKLRLLKMGFLVWCMLNLALAIVMFLISRTIHTESCISVENPVSISLTIFGLIYVASNALLVLCIRKTCDFPTSKHRDNMFALTFADAANPLCEGTKAILFPPEAFKISEKNMQMIDGIIRDLKNRSFLRSDEAISFAPRIRTNEDRDVESQRVLDL